MINSNKQNQQQNERGATGIITVRGVTVTEVRNTESSAMTPTSCVRLCVRVRVCLRVGEFLKLCS